MQTCLVWHLLDGNGKAGYSHECLEDWTTSYLPFASNLDNHDKFYGIKLSKVLLSTAAVYSLTATYFYLGLIIFNQCLDPFYILP